MKLYAYVVKYDTGFALNPFGGFLTLATCKPRIRANISVGDLLFGTGSASGVGNDKLVYAAIVNKIESLENYGSSPRYEIKIPRTRRDWWRKHGDNIYFRADGEWQMRRNIHHGIADLERDTNGQQSLICPAFWYFGRNAVDIPELFLSVVKRGPGCKITTDETLINELLAWLDGQPSGINGLPELEPDKP